MAFIRIFELCISEGTHHTTVHTKLYTVKVADRSRVAEEFGSQTIHSATIHGPKLYMWNVYRYLK